MSRPLTVLSLVALTVLTGGSPADPLTTPAAAAAPVDSPSRVTGALPQIRNAGYPVSDGAVHVALTGRDSNAGTAAAPLATLAAALTKARPGATIVVGDGTYRTTGGVKIRKQVTIQPAAGAQVWFKGSRPVDGWRAEGGRWCVPWTHRLEIPSRERPSDYLDPKYPLANRREAVYINDSELTQVASIDRVRSGQFAVDGKRLCVGSDPGGRRVESVVDQYGLQVFGKAAAGTVIRGIGVAHYGDVGLMLQAPRVVAQDVTAVRNGIVGLSAQGLDVNTDMVVRGSNLSYNGRKGMTAGSAHNLLIENTVVAHNNTQGFRLAWDAAGAKIMHTKNLKVRNSTFAGNFSMGLWMDINVLDAQVIGNSFLDNKVFGAFFEISRGALIANNVSMRNGAGLAVSNSKGARLVNNTLIDNRMANIFVKQSQRTPRERELDMGVTFVTRDVQVYNNLLVMTAASGGGSQVKTELWPCNAGSEPMVTRLDHNGYRDENPTKGDTARLVPLNSNCKAAPMRSLSQLQSANLERNGTRLDGPAGDSLFRDPQRGDYRLAEGSPAKGKGAPLPADVAAAMGAPAGRAVDLGVLSGLTLPANPAPVATSPSSATPTPTPSASGPAVGNGQPQPSDPATTPGTEPVSEEEELPLTGAGLGLAVIAAMAAVLVGAGLLMVTRRRRSTP